MAETSVLDFTMKTIDGEQKPLAAYRGKVLLFVNVATYCGNTPQYAPLEKLYETYRDRGLVVLGFPANNFGAQEPGTDPEIKTFCTTKYGVAFDMFSKISVKGADIHPLYAYLTSRPGLAGDVTWNFGKFLADRHGRVVARFTPKTAPDAPDLVAKIEALLAQP